MSLQTFLIKRFVTAKSLGGERSRHERCGRLSGIVGICLNLALGALKLAVGLVSGSVAITADSVNNLSDATASVITLVGFSLAARKSDAEHPYGHARIEYMTGVIVSAFIVVVGGALILESYQRVFQAESLSLTPATGAILVVLIFAKVWMYRFNKALSRLIGSASLKATAIDSRNDAASSVCVLLALAADKAFGIGLDAYAGIGIGVFIIYSGLNMVKETAAPLLGQSPDPKTLRGISRIINETQGIIGFHDLIVHDYGPSHLFASVHIEVDSRMDVFASHEVIDQIEQDALSRLGVRLVAHMDPVDTQDERLAHLRETIGSALEHIPGVRGWHDLRVVPGAGRTNVIFDIVTVHDDAAAVFTKAKQSVESALAESGGKYSVAISRDEDYAPGWEPETP